MTSPSPEELTNRFTYHAPKEGQADLYQGIRSDVHEVARWMVQVCPPGRELSLALTKLEEAVFWANAAIARS